MGPRTAIIIGAGPAGLVAAIHLQRLGVRVTVLEAKGRPGGRASSDRHEGFTLNQGPHALFLRGAARREFRRLGFDPAGRLPKALNPLGVTPGGEVRTVIGKGLASLGARTLRAKPEQ